MENIAVLVFFICFFVGIISFGFLSSIQPIWTIIEIAVSTKLSKAAKITLLILILVGLPLAIISVFGLIFAPIIALIPFFYGCFFTASPALRKVTRISFLVFICALIGVIGAAFTSNKVQDNIKQIKKIKIKGHAISVELKEQEGESLEKWQSCNSVSDCVIAKNPCGRHSAVNKRHLKEYETWAEKTTWHCRAGWMGWELIWQNNAKDYLACEKSKCIIQQPTDEEKEKLSEKVVW